MKENNLFVHINGRTIRKEEVELMTVDQITKLLNEIQIGLIDCKYRLTTEKRKSPKKQSLEIINKVEKAMVNYQNSMHWISCIRSEKRKVNNATMNSFFVDCARENLDKRTFEKILDKAKTKFELVTLGV